MTQPTKLAIISSRLIMKPFQEGLGDDWKVVSYQGFFDVDPNSSPATIMLDSYTDAQKERMAEIQQSIDKGNYQKVMFVMEHDSFGRAYTRRLRDNLNFTCDVQEVVWLEPS